MGLVSRNAQKSIRSYTISSRNLCKVPYEVRPAHMDEIPVPSGSWQEAYNKAQSKYNLQLAAGILTLAAAITFGRMHGVLWLNYSPPVPKKE